MGSSEKLRVFIFEDDVVLSDLFKNILQSFGCDVQTFTDPTVCAVYRTPECNCPRDSPCTDVLITDIMMPNINGIELLKLQRKRGCKALDANKAVMSATASPQQLAEVEGLGCHFFRKPFKLAEIKNWLDTCSLRISASKDI